MTSIQNLITTKAVIDLLENYERAKSSEKVQSEIVTEIRAHAENMLADLESMKDILGTAYTHLAQAIQLLVCEKCEHVQ